MRPKGVDHYNYGKHLSDETKERIRRTKAGINFSEEHKKKLSLARRRYLRKIKYQTREYK